MAPPHDRFGGEIRPRDLDAAIDTLPEADRQVLLLHFVNEMTFPEIATRVGKSAAAVQKQAIEFLNEQGIDPQEMIRYE